MVCCLDGLVMEQWVLAYIIGASVIIVNFILKLLPDGLCPKLGKDSVDERRVAAKEGKAQITDV